VLHGSFSLWVGGGADELNIPPRRQRTVQRT
jgi:hypothetical protein